MTFTALNKLLNVSVGSISAFWCGVDPVFYSFSRYDWFTASFDEHVENKTLKNVFHS